MATSSITHDFFIDDKTAVERFACAIEKLEEQRDKAPKPSVKHRHMTDPKELQTFFDKIRNNVR